MDSFKNPEIITMRVLGFSHEQIEKGFWDLPLGVVCIFRLDGLHLSLLGGPPTVQYTDSHPGTGPTSWRTRGNFLETSG